MKNNCVTCDYIECEKHKENEAKPFGNIDIETFFKGMSLFQKTWALIERTSKFITPEIKDKLLNGEISMEDVLAEYEKCVESKEEEC